MGRRNDLCHQPPAGTHHLSALRFGARDAGRQGLLRHTVDGARERTLPLAQRHVEVQPRERTLEASDGFLQRQLRCEPLGRHSRAFQLGDARLRPPHLLQCGVSARQHTALHHGAARLQRRRRELWHQPRGFVCAHLHPPGFVGRTPHNHSFRRRVFGGHDLAQWSRSGLSSGFEQRERIRPHALSAPRREPLGGAGDALERRFVSRVSGHVPHERHLPRRLPLQCARGCRLRSPHHRGAVQRLSGCGRDPRFRSAQSHETGRNQGGGARRVQPRRQESGFAALAAQRPGRQGYGLGAPTGEVRPEERDDLDGRNAPSLHLPLPSV